MRRGRAWERLATIGLGLALSLGHLAPAAPPSNKAPTIHHKQRAFRIPFNIDPADRPRYKQVQLWAFSSGVGKWTQADATTPDRPSFTFRATRDGEYWFSVRTLDTKNRLIPADDADIEPNMKVIVDTVAPTINLEAMPRRGNIAAVRWEVVEEHLDLGSLQLEYQAEGAKDWAQVPIRKPARMGVETWDAGTAEPLKVRASAADKAGNRTVVPLNLPDGAPGGDPGASPGDVADPNVPPARSNFATAEGDRSAPASILPGPAPMPAMDAGPSPSPASAGGFNPFTTGGPVQAGPAPGGTSPDAPAPPILVASPRFGLQYEVEDAGPNGPAAVELYVTTDGGRTWFSRGEDADKRSPFQVDLGGEGTFGLKLVARSAANQGDQPPNPGELPRTVVEVDSTGPDVKLDPPKVVGNRALLTWHAKDPHPAPRSVMISVRSDAPDGHWQSITPAPIENNGHFTWVLPARCPPRIHFRVDVLDALGNRGHAETIEMGAVLVDRTRPRGRILGLDPSTRDGTGPSAKPLR